MSLVGLGAGSAVRPVLDAFPLSATSLTPGSQEAEAAELNAEFLRMIDIECMLWTFRQNARLQPVEGSAPFWGVSRACRMFCTVGGVVDVHYESSPGAELGRSISGSARTIHWALPQCGCALVQPHRQVHAPFALAAQLPTSRAAMCACRHTLLGQRG